MARDPIWGDSGLSIILLPSGEQGQSLFDVARAWTQLNLLSPSLWIKPEWYDNSKGNPPRQTASVIAPSSDGDVIDIEVDLFEQLARQDLSKIRLLVVRTATPSSAFDSKQDELVGIISGYLERAVPRTTSAKDPESAHSVLTKINLITAPTEFAPDYQHEVVDQLFNAHFVASPEDRSSPLSGDAFVRSEPGSGRFAGFTLLHVATLGALWHGLPQGGFELAQQANWSGDKVYVSRVFASAILTDGLIQRACARVLRRAANATEGFTDLSVDFAVDGTYPIPDSDVDGYIAKMVELTFGFRDGILTYKPAVEDAAPEKYRLGALAQLGDFFVFSGNKLLRVPYYTLRWFWKKLVGILNALFQGGNKGASEVVGPEDALDPRDTAVARKYDEVEHALQRAREAMLSPVGNSPVRSTPDLWEKIRKLVFGFLDGSSLHLFGINRADNGWPIFYRVSSMFSDPADVLTVPDPADRRKKLNLKWMDLEQATSIQIDLRSQAAKTKSAMDSSISRAATSNSDIERLEDEIRELELLLDLEDINQSAQGEEAARG